MIECPMCGWADGRHDPLYFCGRQVLDLAEGRRRKEVGLALAESPPSREAWINEARWLLLQTAQQHPTVTSDMVWQAGLPEAPWASSVMGSVFAWAARSGILASTDRITISARPSRHATSMRVWRSLVCGDTER